MARVIDNTKRYKAVGYISSPAVPIDDYYDFEHCFLDEKNFHYGLIYGSFPPGIIFEKNKTTRYKISGSYGKYCLKEAFSMMIKFTSF